jgi:hypothetical protein
VLLNSSVELARIGANFSELRECEWPATRAVPMTPRKARRWRPCPAPLANMREHGVASVDARRRSFRAERVAQDPAGQHVLN